MKRFTQKFFLLAIGMILSTGAFAQDEITHRYPAIPFTYNEHTYEMPGWDIKLTADADIRIQTIAPLPATTSDHFKGKIVARRVFNNDSQYNYGDYMFSSSPTEADIIIGGKKLADLPVGEGETAPTKWTYGLACDVLGITIADEARSMEVFTIKLLTREDYTIPGTYKVNATSTSATYAGRTFDIVEIGVGAFRNSGPTSPNLFKISGTFTIPNTITKIEHNAFRHGVFKNVVFEAGSTIETIEKATFEGCKNLETINIPASVGTIKGTAFGSCTNLKKVVFEGNLPTLTKEDEEPTYPNANSYPGPYNIFQGARRFISNGTTGANVTPSKCIIEVPLGTAKSYINSNDGLFAQFPMSSKFPVTASSGMMSYCSDMDFTFKQYNTDDPTSWGAAPVKVYYVKDTDVDVDNGKVLLTEISDLNADTQNKLVPGWAEGNDFGVVIKGTSGETYDIFFPNGKGGMTEKLTMDGTDNCLHGCVERTLIDVENEDYEFTSFFVLSGGTFHRVMTNGYCKENRAYIMVADGGYGGSIGTDPSDPDGGARELVISFPEDTGIESHEVKNVQNDAWYTLQGIQVNQPSKGIFIKNGKKYIVK